MAGPDARVLERAQAGFSAVFGATVPPRVALAPGRVNLIGEHTDYNEGFVLPMAIDRVAVVAFHRRADRMLRCHSVAFAETRELALDGLAPPGGHDWFSYVAGVVWAFGCEGLAVPGLDVVVDGDIPIGAGLSSSAALEMAVARALCDAGGFEWDPRRMARLGHKAENDYVGTRCGIMDQFASAASREGSALLLDCRSLEARAVPLPKDAAWVVMDTGVRRSLARSAYNERREACERVVRELQGRDPSVRALRDVTPELLEEARGSLDPMDVLRASHVVRENRRPLEMAEAVEAGDLARAGQLMNDSHASLRDLYDVSCEELDRITELAREQPGCHGARMTGAGFGGCAVALVQADAAAAVCREVRARYEAQFASKAALYVCRPGPGARLLT